MTGVATGDATEAPTTVEGRVIDAALECFARWGIQKTTIEDIARDAGVSRATVYRSFPGGKASILDAVGVSEIVRMMDEVTAAVAAAPDLATTLVDGIVVGSRVLRTHRALQFLLAHEREAILPFLAFDRIDPALALTRQGCAPLLERFVPRATAEELVEWATRMVLSLTFAPGLVDPSDHDAVRSMVHDLLLPGVAGEQHPAVPPTALHPATESTPATESRATSRRAAP